MKRNGFTLVEVFIVLALLVFLAAITVPPYLAAAKAKKKRESQAALEQQKVTNLQQADVSKPVTKPDFSDKDTKYDLGDMVRSKLNSHLGMIVSINDVQRDYAAYTVRFPMNTNVFISTQVDVEDNDLFVDVEMKDFELKSKYER